MLVCFNLQHDYHQQGNDSGSSSDCDRGYESSDDNGGAQDDENYHLQLILWEQFTNILERFSNILELITRLITRLTRLLIYPPERPVRGVAWLFYHDPSSDDSGDAQEDVSTCCCVIVLFNDRFLAGKLISLAITIYELYVFVILLLRSLHKFTAKIYHYYGKQRQIIPF